MMVLCFVVLVFGVANAAARTVDTTSDDGTLTACTLAANDCSLRGAISGAAANDTIKFSTDLNNQTITLTTNSEININKSLTINGPGANLLTIDGGPNANRIFYINAGDVVIRGVTMQGGNGAGSVGTGYGGAIFLTSNSLRLERVAMQNNSADYGGAIRSTSHLVIIHSTFNGNNANLRGGAIDHESYTDGLFYLENSTISGNTLTASQNLRYGGGIWATSPNLNSRVNFATIVNNGAIFTLGSGAFLNGVRVTNSLITQNIGTNLGGNYTGSFNIISGPPGLGALDYHGGSTKTHSVISGSPVIDAADPNNANNPPDDQRGVTRAFNGRSDIGAVEYSPNVVINADNFGAGSLRQVIAEAAAGDTISFDPNIFNQPRTIVDRLDIFKNLTIIGPGSGLLTLSAGGGGRVLNIDGGVTVTISGISFANGNIGANVSAGGILINGNSRLDATDIIVENCAAGVHGGGIYNTGILNLTDSIVRGNTSGQGGGGIYNDGTAATILRSTVSGNTSGAGGGGIFSNGALNLTDSIVENNNAGGGGGIAFVPANLTANITRSIVRLNTANNNSGGIFNAGTLNFIDSTLNGNTSLFAGGLTNGGFANIVNSTVSGNRSTTTRGGGIFNGTGNTLHLLNSTITNNQSDSFAGAGVYNENVNNPTITVRAQNTIIAGNISGAGNPVDYVGDITNLGNNLINNANPGLAPLGNYGGATPTHALLANSPALNAGDNCALTINTCGIAHSALVNDQRGTNAPRKIGANIDLGAFERNITFNQTNLPNGNVNLYFDQTLSAARQTNFVEFTENLAPFTFSIIPIAGQQLPPGLTLAPDGTISGTPTQTGTFTFTVKTTDADAMASAQQFTMQILAPTAANVSISGRVLTPDGRGLRNAFVILTDASGNSRTVRTTAFGYYVFEDISAGHTYTFSIRSKHFQFAPRVVNVTEDLSEFDFTALEQ